MYGLFLCMLVLSSIFALSSAMALFNRNKTGESAEMSFVDHLEVLRGHLFRCVIAIVIGGIVVAVYNDFFVRDILMGPTHGNFPTYAWLCRAGHSLGMG